MQIWAVIGAPHLKDLLRRQVRPKVRVVLKDKLVFAVALGQRRALLVHLLPEMSAEEGVGHTILRDVFRFLCRSRLR